MDFNELESKEVSKEINVSELVGDCFINIDEELTPPEILLSIGQHEYKGYFYDTPIMTAGEFSAIIAVSKAKKSFIKSGFLAAYIGGRANDLLPNIKSHRKDDFTVLDFDTEQGKYYTQRSFRRVKELSNPNYEHYYGYATRHLTSDERLKVIDFCLSNQKELYKKPVKLVAIDGIADLVENTNDIVLSKEASDFILKWTHIYNIHVITIIHKSGVTGKPLGHLGTYVLKKAETVINLDVEDGDIVRVSNPFSRGYKFDDFCFKINNEALPYLID